MKRFFTFLFLSNLILASAWAEEVSIDDCFQGASSSAIEEVTRLGVQCFNEWSSFVPVTNSQAFHQLMGDRDICQCLSQNPLVRSDFERSSIRNPDFRFNPEIGTVRTINQRLGALRNGLIFQSALLSPDPAVNERALRNYNQSYISDEIRAGLESIQSRFRGSSEQIAVPEPDPRLASGTLEGDQCITFQEYRAFRQFPSDNNFYVDLARETSFNQADWDFASIRERIVRLEIKGAMEPDHPEYALAQRLMSRLDFLSSNPLYRNLFSAGSGNVRDPGLLRRMQGELFDTIKQNLGNANCVRDQRQSCLNQILRGDGLQRLRTKAQEIFSNSAVVEMVTEQGIHDFNKLIISIRNEGSNTAPSRALISEQIPGNPFGGIRSCTDSQEGSRPGARDYEIQAANRCYLAYRNYCPTLVPMVDGIMRTNAMSDEPVTQELTREAVEEEIDANHNGVLSFTGTES